MSQLSEKLNIPSGTKRIVLCFGFEHSESHFPGRRGDPTGAEILIEVLRRRFIPGYHPVVVTHPGTDEYLRRVLGEATVVDKNKLRFGSLGFDRGPVTNIFFPQSLMAEAEAIARRYHPYRRIRSSEIKRLVIAKISRWAEFLSGFEQVFFLHGNVPHGFDDLVSYRVAESMGHLCLSAYRLPIVPGKCARLMLFSDPFRQDRPIRLPELPSQLPNVDDLEKVIAHFVAAAEDQISGATQDSPPMSAALVKAPDSSAQFPKAEKRSFGTLRQCIGVLRRFWMPGGPDAIDTYFSYLRKAAKTIPERFVYFPLHMQPEASSCPLGGVYGDQEILVAALSKALPKGVKLAVKEHPKQLAYGKLFFRGGGFYRRICADENVVLLHHDVPAQLLLSRCLAAVTLTGTTAFEALALRKYCFVMGASPFACAPNALIPKSMTSLKDDLARLAGGRMPPIEDVAVSRFLDWVRVHSVFGYLDPYTHPRLGGLFSQDANIQAVSDAIVAAIDYVETMGKPHCNAPSGEQLPI